MKVEAQVLAKDAFTLGLVNMSPKSESKSDAMEAKLETSKQEPTVEEITEAVEFANKAMKMSRHYLEFVVEEDNPRYQVKVVNSESGEVIREIPSDYMMNISKKIQEMMDQTLGILVDEIV